MFQIELTADSKRVIQKMESPDWLLRGLKQGMDRENQFTLAHIAEARLTGKGPFPVEEHKLGVRTGLLRRSVRASAAVESGPTKVQSTIGTNVKYAAVHEYGFNEEVTVSPHSRKRKISWMLQKSTKGQERAFEREEKAMLKAFAKGEGGLSAARGSADLKREYVKKTGRRDTFVGVFKRKMKMPERRPIQTGIEDRQVDYGQGISAAIVKAWVKATGG